MSLETEIKKLTEALNAHTTAISNQSPSPLATATPEPVGYTQPSPAISTPDRITPPAAQPASPAPAVHVPAQAEAAPTTPAPGTITVEDLNTLMIAKSREVDQGVPKVLAVLAQFGGATKLNQVPEADWPQVVSMISAID